MSKEIAIENGRVKMNKETKKFEIKVTETITTTHEVEVPISFLDQHLKKRIGDDIEGIVHDNYAEFIEEPDMETKTITDVDFHLGTDVDVEEITDE
jgi:hypothetical protein